MLKLLIDDREQKTILFFKESYEGVEIEVKRLQVADYVISQNGKILFAIERKTWADLSSSIKDGRKTNINKLISLREQTGCKLIYLIEGKARFKPTKKISRIPYKSLQAHLDHLMIRDNVSVIYSTDEEDTVARLIEFCTNYLSLNINIHPIPMEIDSPAEGGAPINEMAILTTTVPKTDLQLIYNLWQQLPQITDKTASLFIDKGYHISDLLLGKISKAEISTMKYSNGVIIGEKRAAKILKIADAEDNSNYKHCCNLLAELPMITKKTAAIILTKITFNDLLSGKMSQEELSAIKKTEKIKLGPSASKNIYKFLIKSV